MIDNSNEGYLLKVADNLKLIPIAGVFPIENTGAEFFEKRNGTVTVNIAPERGKWAYGKIPRLILLYLSSLIMGRSEKVDFDKKTIVFNESFRSFCKHSGLTYYGGLAEKVDEMLNRILNTTIQFRVRFDAKEERILAVGNYRIFDYGEFHFHDMDTSRKTYIRLSDLLWRILTENCVPLNRGIAAQLGRSPRALDIYQWLAYRTYALKKPVVVSWENLRSQFDSADTPMYSFRRRFCRSLEKVSDAWPELATSVGGKRIDALSQQKLPHFGKRKGKGFRTGVRLFRKGVRRDGKPVLTKSLGHRFFRCPKLLMLENERGKSYATTSLYMAKFCASAISHAVNSTSFKDLSYPQFRSA